MKLKKLIWLLPSLLFFGVAIPVIVTSCSQEVTTQQPGAGIDGNNNNSNNSSSSDNNNSNTGGSNSGSTSTPNTPNNDTPQLPEQDIKPPVEEDPNKIENLKLVEQYKPYENKQVKLTLGDAICTGIFGTIIYDANQDKSIPVVTVTGTWTDLEGSEIPGGDETKSLEVALNNIVHIELVTY